MINVIKSLFFSKKYLYSIGITLLLLGLFYHIALTTGIKSGLKDVNLFSSIYLVLLSLVFYIRLFNEFFRLDYIRFLRINIETKTFFSYLLKLFFVLFLTILVLVLLVYFSVNSLNPDYTINSSEFLNGVVFFVLIQPFLILVSFVVSSYSTSIWTLLALVFYFLLEDTIILLLKLKFESIDKYQFLFPFQSFRELYKLDFWHWKLIVPIGFITLLSVLTYKRDYIKL